MSEKQTYGQLNEYQRAAVEDLSPACLVKANVGSGKTTVLVSKVHYLHEKCQVSYEDMTVLTFTNKAANEIRERLGIEEPGYFGTFHSVAMNLLKNRLAEQLEAEAGGWNRDFSVIDPDEELELAQELIAAKGFKIKYKNRLKKRLEEDADLYYSGRGQGKYQDDLFLLFPVLEQEKQRKNKMSFADLIRVATELLQKAEEGTDNWPAWILVDEVQDSDRKQMEFLTALKKSDTHFFAVGDPNQVIYSWRGGMESMFYEMKHRFQAKELSLPLNYRSSAEILEAASRFMQNGNHLEGSRREGNKITVKNHYDPFQEAMYLADRIRELRKQGMEYREIAIFYRKQNQAEVLEKVFGKEEIPYTVSLRKTVKDLPVLDWAIRVLKYACGEEDAFSAEAALMDKIYGEAKTKKAAAKLVAEHRFAISPLFDRMCGYSMRFDREIVDNNKKREYLEEWYRYWDFDACIHPTSSSYQSDRALLEQLFDKIFACAEQKHMTLYRGTEEYLKSAALYGWQTAGEENQDAVHLMTLHASKGLEFSHVFLIGVNQGLIPLPGKTPEAEEEERRLFFVGMTRAKDSLELSYYTNPGEPGVLGGPGWYLKMLPGHVLDWPENRAEEEKRGHLQNLRRAVEEKRRRRLEEEEAEIQSQADLFSIDTDKDQKEQEILEKTDTAASSIRRVRHAKYGTGIVTSEDDMMIEAEFENYGKKQFVKAFSGLQFIEE